jgi:hypothetical protein
MRRFHNPRYAPESLERKLSPSGFATIPVAAHIHVQSFQTTQVTQVTPIVASDLNATTAPLHASRLPIVVVPPISGHATHPIHTALDDPTQPGDPEPTDPTDPSGGTDPAPPPGSGDPPVGQPSTPGGTPVPTS